MRDKLYGECTESEFKGSLELLGPNISGDAESIKFWSARMRANERYDRFSQAFRECLLDDSLSFEEKALKYLDEDLLSGESWDYFKWIWELFAPGEAWPLEGYPRPVDEASAKQQEFKPK